MNKLNKIFLILLLIGVVNLVSIAVIGIAIKLLELHDPVLDIMLLCGVVSMIGVIGYVMTESYDNEDI